MATDTKILDNTGDAPDLDALPLYSITAYGADLPVDGLVKRIQSQDIYIPSFQRGFVWTKRQADRFVESLLLGLPVPGIFLARESDSHKLVVIDGQQRLRTLEFFCSGMFGEHRYALDDVHPHFKGKTYDTLDDEDRRRLDDTIIHATIVRQDKPAEDDSSIYHIFERLNTGGTALQAQEIRASTYAGPFIELLEELDKTPQWREIYGAPSKRLKDQELILRFLALFYNAAKYQRPMEKFLNDFMASHRRVKPDNAEEFRRVFTETIGMISTAIGRHAFRSKRALNAAIFDAVMVGVARRLADGPIDGPKGLLRAYEGLLKKEAFQLTSTRSTADVDFVRRRLSLATNAFAKIK